MRKLVLLFAVSAFVAAAPALIPSATACQPVPDTSAQKVETPTETLYYKTSTFTIRHPVHVPVVTNIWRETNGLPGLQLNEEMGCGVERDFEWVNARFF